MGIPFDFPNTNFELGHHEGKCTFEAIIEKYDVKDPWVKEMAKIVHAADIATDTDKVPEARGLEAISAGSMYLVKDDYEALEKGFAMYDALYIYVQLEKLREKYKDELVKMEIERLETELPPGTKIEMVRDGSIMIRDSVRDVQETLILGGILTILIVFLFLNSWRSTVITGLTLPISVIASFIVMNFLGMTLNVLTLIRKRFSKEKPLKGVKVAITNMNLTGDTSFLAGGYTSDDATNGKIVGTNAAEFIKANLKGDVNIGQVDFDDQLKAQSQARWGGFYAGLDAAGVKYNKVAAVSSHIQDDAVTKVSDMLTAHPEINVIFAINDLDETLPAPLGVGCQAIGGQLRGRIPEQRPQRIGCKGCRRHLRCVVPRTHGRVQPDEGAGTLVYRPQGRDDDLERQGSPNSQIEF
jgi:hypothetical protein